jgi:dihydroorotase-like cyclic amidohydrolase
MSVLIKGGRVVTTTDDVRADVLVEGEQISLIGASGAGRRAAAAGERRG